MKLNEVVKVLSTCVKARLPVLLEGAPGVGKSDLTEQVAQATGCELLISHPVVNDPTQAKGLPFPSKDGKRATFLPYGDLERALNAKVPLLWFLDDLGQAPAAVQASYMQLLLARRIGEHALPDTVTFVAATNRKSDRAGVSGLLEPVKSRFATILNVEPDLDSWVQWALTHDMPAELIGFLRFRPDLLHAFRPTSDLTNSASPRTWANLGKLMNAGIDPLEHVEVGNGTVGADAATELRAFLKLWSDLVMPDSILLDPEHARIPEEASTLYALTSALATLANEENFSRILRYAYRLHDAGKGEFSAYLVRDCALRNPDVTKSLAYVDAATGPLASLFN